MKLSSPSSVRETAHRLSSVSLRAHLMRISYLILAPQAQMSLGELDELIACMFARRWQEDICNDLTWCTTSTLINLLSSGREKRRKRHVATNDAASLTLRQISRIATVFLPRSFSRTAPGFFGIEPGEPFFSGADRRLPRFSTASSPRCGFISTLLLTSRVRVIRHWLITNRTQWRGRLVNNSEKSPYPNVFIYLNN